MIAFLDASKYPPSLLFLLMTLGPAMLLLAWFERWTGAVAQFFATIGRVPFFFYVLRIYLILALTVACGVLQGFPAASMMDSAFMLPPTFGYSLAMVYAYLDRRGPGIVSGVPMVRRREGAPSASAAVVSVKARSSGATARPAWIAPRT